MSNTWFEFKQFKVNQQNAAFKVGTDACLLGSWIDAAHAKRILDIGTGSGVIALMLAQKSVATIDAIDIDMASSRQAKENFEASPWTERVFAHHKSLVEFAGETTYKFDLIVSNPPYFVGSTKNLSERKKNARHEGELDLPALLSLSWRLASDSGKLALILPFDRYDELIAESLRHSWHVGQQLLIRPRRHKTFNRFIVVLSKSPIQNIKYSEITIYKEGQAYTEDVIKLFSPFYLHL